MVSRLDELSLQELYDHGVRGLLLDLDRTLTPWATTQIPDSSFAFVSKAKASGFKLCIVSNSLLKRQHVEKVARALDIPYVASAFKPRRLGLRKAMKILSLSPQQCCIIGDQLLTDVLAGRRAGMKTVLVMPMGEREFFLTKIINRSLERWLMRTWRKT